MRFPLIVPPAAADDKRLSVRPGNRGSALSFLPITLRRAFGRQLCQTNSLYGVARDVRQVWDPTDFAASVGLRSLASRLAQVLCAGPRQLKTGHEKRPTANCGWPGPHKPYRSPAPSIGNAPRAVAGRRGPWSSFPARSY